MDDKTPFPLSFSFALAAVRLYFCFVSGLVMSWSAQGTFLLKLGVIIITLSCTGWWSNVINESTAIGFHTKRVQYGLRLGIGLFIVSEIFFFLGFFEHIYIVHYLRM